MLTYLPEERILFTCDLFGTHLATSALYASEDERMLPAAKRYYGEIMMPFAHVIPGHLNRIDELEVEAIAPSHGPIHDQPQQIVDAYRHWVEAPPSNRVLLPHTSMHGSTKAMVEFLIAALVDRGVAVEPFAAESIDLGAYVMGLVDAATVVFATPTVLLGPHPSILAVAYLTSALRPKLKQAAVIGSYGWGGKAAENTRALCGNLKVEWLEPVFAKGYPDPQAYAMLDSLADAIAHRHQGLGPGTPTNGAGSTGKPA
jgi:flavorubredoxin